MQSITLLKVNAEVLYFRNEPLAYVMLRVSWQNGDGIKIFIGATVVLMIGIS